MLAFPEMLKSLTPIKTAFSKGSSFRRHFFDKFTDLIAIILSIYLALSIEGWADKRKEHKKLTQYYQNLMGEIIKDTVSLTSTLKDAELHIGNANQHLALLKRYKPELEDSVTSYLNKMMSSQLFYSSQMTTYKSLQASGEIKLIENLAIRDTLIRLDEVYQSLKIYEDMYLAYIENDLTNILKENFDLIDNILVNKDCYEQIQYRNNVAVFQSLNRIRLEQYIIAIPKAREALKIIQHELERKK